jgi:hypothetical protein
MKNSNGTVGTRTRDLSAYSAMNNEGKAPDFCLRYRLIFFLFSPQFTDECVTVCCKVFRGAHTSGARSPGLLNSVRWRLIFCGSSEPDSCHPSGACNFDVSCRFSENSRILALLVRHL